MNIPITHSFSVASEITAAMAFLDSDPTKALIELEDTERALFDRRRDMVREDYFAARDSIRDAADTIKTHVRDNMSGDWEANWHTGVLLSRLDRDKSALEFLERAEESNPEDAIIGRKIIHSLLKLHKHQSDGGFAERAVTVGLKRAEIDGEPKTYEHLGDAYLATSDFASAFEAFDKASDTYTEHDPSNGYAERRASEMLRRYLDRAEDAIAYAEDAYEIDPASPRNVEELAFAYADAREHHRAIPYLMQAHYLKPDYKPTLFKLIDALVEAEQYDTATDFAKRFETHAGERELSLAKQLRIAERDPRGASRAFAIAEQLETEFGDVFETRKSLAGFYYAREMYDQALPFLTSVAEKPGGENYLNRAAQALRISGDVNGSARLVQDALARNSHNRFALLAAGWHFLDTGNPGSAHQYAQELERVAPDFRLGQNLLRRTSDAVDGLGYSADPVA